MRAKSLPANDLIAAAREAIREYPRVKRERDQYRALASLFGIMLGAMTLLWMVTR